ncbi:11508_t:CDS:2 [Dentiscutata erythropus]|uniref:11508_t:CDS:1 n=1 Tax=Dentiscutata erythropus TaxID=1348616 RepID=A0A9N9ANP3_9GLOM|nr:11508_t:CDS:2 [Dentiscutata erythropus]
MEMQKVAIIVNKQIRAKYRHLKPHSLLKEIRELLSHMLEDELFLINDSAIFFEDLNGNKIDKSQENSIRLRGILLYGYILNIIVEKHDATTATKSGHKNSTKYKIFDRIRAEFTVDECDVEPTDHFISEVIDALKGPRDKQQENLIEVTKKFGEFWAQSVYLGGFALQTLNNASDSHNISQVNRGQTIGGSSNELLSNTGFENIASGSRTTQIQDLIWFGGDDIDISCEEDLSVWTKSIKQKNWNVVKFIKIISIFELLNKELRNQVLRAFGKTIFYSKVDSLNFILDLSKMEPYAYELSIPKNLPSTDYQVFAMIMSKSKQDDVFGMRIVYENNKKPVILLHRIGTKTKFKSRRKQYSLEIGWVVIGYPNKFDFGKYKIERSLVSEKVDIDLQGNNNVYDYRRSTIVTAQHFHDKTSGLSSCIFVHDLYKRKYVNILQELENLTFEYSIINDQENSKQVVITWDKSVLSRAKILSGTIKNSNLNLNHPNFLTLLYDDDGYCNCSNEFVNICPDCVMLRSLGEFNQQNSLAIYYYPTDDT